MSQNNLFKQLCSHELMLTGWHLAHADSRDNFVLDPVGYVDFTSYLDERLEHLVEQVQTHKYRPRHLTEIDLPKSGLSVRPGNVLPIEESVLLHSISYLLAPLLDKQLSGSVYSYRLHPEWKKRIKKRNSLFRETKVDFPFLRRTTIRSISPFDAWYERWPAFEKAAILACTTEGYTHLTKTDITAYFENIDLRLLETQIRSLLKGKEEKIIHLLFRILDGWTRDTSTGTPIERGIPQGNEVSSFLGNIYLMPLDSELEKFCQRNNAKWFRYVDDVKVFTRSEEDARQVVFVINDALRRLHLNLQGSKTKILSGTDLSKELDDSEIKKIDGVYNTIKKIDPNKQENAKKITKCLRVTGDFISRFRSNLPYAVKNLSNKDNRLFRRLMTIYGYCKRTHLKRAALSALKELPDLRILEKTLTYLSQLDYSTHDEITLALINMLETRQLPFPYQIGSVLETISILHPYDVNKKASWARQYALNRKQHWFVVQKSLELIFSYPYAQKYSESLANKYLNYHNPMVRRAACILMLKGSKNSVEGKLRELIFHPDHNLGRLSLYFLRLLQDESFAQKELSRISNSHRTDLSLQRNLPTLYAISSTDNKKIVEKTYNYLIKKFKTKSNKIDWHKNMLFNKLNYSQI